MTNKQKLKNRSTKAPKLKKSWKLNFVSEYRGKTGAFSKAVAKRLEQAFSLALESLPQSALESVPEECSGVQVLFVDDKAIHKINKRWRQKDKATDVISFPALEAKFPGPCLELGDIIISIDTAKRQAKEFGCSFFEEMLRLLIHGMLHLLGFDHVGVSKNKANQMRRLERKILKTCVFRAQ